MLSQSYQHLVKTLQPLILNFLTTMLLYTLLNRSVKIIYVQHLITNIIIILECIDVLVSLFVLLDVLFTLNTRNSNSPNILYA